MLLSILKTTIASTLILFAVAANARAGILTEIDVLNLDGVAESSLLAANMTTARSVLTNEGATITDIPVGSLSAADLVGIDILYVGMANNAFTGSQLTDIVNFVNGGGGLVAVGTERSSLSGPAWEEIANSFGVTGLGGDRVSKASATNPASPIVSGLFGTAITYNPAAAGAFSTSLPVGTDIVWESVDDNPIIITLDVASRAVFFADTNFMQNSYIGYGDNATIWGNAFAFTGDVAAVPAVPEPSSLFLLGIGGISLLGYSYRRKRQQAA